MAPCSWIWADPMAGMVIIGAGECGTRAAFALREQGWQGAITLIGDEAGLPYERPPLSKGAARKDICAAAALDAAGIDYLHDTQVLRIDPVGRQVVLADGAIDYGRLLLATGAAPRRLTCPGADQVLDFRTGADAAQVFGAMRPGLRVAIIGAGLIGMELAAVLRQAGAEVDVIEAGATPMTRAVPPHFAAHLMQRHLAEGVRVHVNAQVARIDGGVHLADGRHIAADLVIGAIGVVPRADLAQDAGLACNNGIQVDLHLQTNRPDILAAGDCASVPDGTGRHVRLETWQNARNQAELAARNMLGAGAAYRALPWFWSDQYDLGLQVAGLPAPEHRMVCRPLANGAEIAFYLHGGELVAAAALGPGNSIARDIKLAQMLIGTSPDADALTDPAVPLKSLLPRNRAA